MCGRPRLLPAIVCLIVSLMTFQTRLSNSPEPDMALMTQYYRHIVILTIIIIITVALQAHLFYLPLEPDTALMTQYYHYCHHDCCHQHLHSHQPHPHHCPHIIITITITIILALQAPYSHLPRARYGSDDPTPGNTLAPPPPCPEYQASIFFAIFRNWKIINFQSRQKWAVP